MKRFSALLAFLLALAAPSALGVDINGQLKKAQLEQQSSDPTAATARVYFNTLTNTAKIYNGTAWTSLGSGAGSGEKNYVSNGSSSAVGWTASSGNITCATTTSNMPDPSLGTALAVTGVSGSTDFCYTNFTLDDADFSKKLKLAWDQYAVSNTSADFRVDVCACAVAWSGGACSAGTVAQGCGTNSTRLPLSTDSSSASLLPALTGTYRTTYDAIGTSKKYMQVQVGLAQTNTHQVNLANIVTGPGVVTQGAAVTQWQSYTPVIANLTTSSAVGQYRRTGDTLEINITATASAAATGNINFPLPSGYTINSSAIPFASSNNALGVALDNHAAGNVYTGAVVYSTSTAVIVWSTNTAGVWNATIPVAGSSGDVFSVNFKVPVNELAGSGTVNVSNNDLSYYYGTGGTWGTSSTITTAQGAGGVLGGTTTPASTSFAYTLVPTTPVPVGTKPVLEISPDGTHWSPVGAGTVTAQYIESLRFDGTNFIGAQAGLNSSGQIVVTFGKYAAGTSAAWSGTWYWRVTVGLPGQAVGFSMASDTSAGLVKLPTGYTQTTVADYQTDDTTLAAVTFLGNGAGSAASSAIAVRVTRSGRLVTVSVPALTTVIPSGTSTHIDANTAFPTWARPAISWQSPAWVYNANATWAVGLINVTTTGFIQFYRDQASTAFTAGSNAGWSTISFTYPVN